MHEKTFFYRFWDKKSCECKTNAKLVMYDMVKPTIIAVHSHVNLHQMWMGN